MKKLSAIFIVVIAVLAVFFIVLFFIYRSKFLGTAEYDPKTALTLLGTGVIALLFSLVWMKVSKRILK